MEPSQATIEHQSEMSYTQLEVHNSKLPVNRICADILYKIFVLVVHEPLMPRAVRNALRISHVCQHWRKSALGWPVLWGTIDLNATCRIVDLFMSRSGNAPLTMVWTSPKNLFRPTSSNIHEEESNYWSLGDPNHVSPRLRSLTFRLSPSRFAQMRGILRNPNVPPLQLRHLDIELDYNSLTERKNSTSAPLMDLVQVDPSCLRELQLSLVDLPWLELPHNNLTHFSFCYPPNPPAPSHLLKFLASCPLLRELELILIDLQKDKVAIDTNDISTSIMLEFTQLERLELGAHDMTSYPYLKEISTRIRTGPLLSYFKLYYDNRQDRSEFAWIPDTVSVLNILETVPSGAFSGFKTNRCLCIDVVIYINDFGWYRIQSSPDNTQFWDSTLWIDGSCPLKGPNSLDLDCFTADLDMMRSLSGITYLELNHHAWELPWFAHIPNLFPYLDTLRLRVWNFDIDAVLNSLPTGLKLKTLILENACIYESVDVLLEVVLNAGVEVMELWTRIIEPGSEMTLQTIFRRRGVVVSINGDFLE